MRFSRKPHGKFFRSFFFFTFHHSSPFSLGLNGCVAVVEVCVANICGYFPSFVMAYDVNVFTHSINEWRLMKEQTIDEWSDFWGDFLFSAAADEHIKWVRVCLRACAWPKGALPNDNKNGNIKSNKVVSCCWKVLLLMTFFFLVK